MDEMLIEIMEVLKEAKELIDKRNDALSWRGNQIIYVHIDEKGADILLSNELPKAKAKITQSEPSKSPIDESLYVSKEMTIDGITFSVIEDVKEEENASMAV